ncbi:MAG: zinc ribbon domain-containing protein [Defluviitaleaceae bacterium]|nr:zinc ribbon domain-containing protein [Defluviitaleaceae bacterium]
MILTFVLSVVGIFVGGVGGCLFLAFRPAKPAYVFRDTTPKKFHFFFVAVIIFMALGQLFRVFFMPPMLQILFIVVFVVLAGFSIFGLVTYKIWGVFCAVMLVWVYAAVDFVPEVMMAFSSLTRLDMYIAPGQVGIYALVEYVLLRVVVACFALMVATVYVSVYYVNRRFLFSVGEFPDLVKRCEHCSMPDFGAHSYCPNCGSGLAGSEGSPKPVFKILDKHNFCTECGYEKHGYFCAICNRDKYFSEVLKKFGKKRLLKPIKFLAAFAFVVYIMLTPVFSQSEMHGIMQGRVPPNNTYVAKLHEFLRDPNVAGSQEWLDGYVAAGDRLNEYNSRWRYIDASGLSLNDLILFIRISEAMYNQEAAIRLLGAAISEGDVARVRRLLSVYDGTISAMEYALSIYLRSSIFDEGIIGGFMALFYHGVRFYTEQVHFRFAAFMLVIIGAFCGLAAGLAYRRSRFTKTVTQSDNPVYKKEKRRRALGNLIGATAGLGIFALIVVVAMFFIDTDYKAEYIRAMDNAINVNSGEISVLLSERNFEPKEILALVEQQLGFAEAIVNFQNVPDEFEIFNAEMRRFAQDEIAALLQIKQYVQAGERPPTEVVLNYATLRTEKYPWLMQEHMRILLENMASAIKEIF